MEPSLINSFDHRSGNLPGTQRILSAHLGTCSSSTPQDGFVCLRVCGQSDGSTDLQQLHSPPGTSPEGNHSFSQFNKLVSPRRYGLTLINSVLNSKEESIWLACFGLGVLFCDQRAGTDSRNVACKSPPFWAGSADSPAGSVHPDVPQSKLSSVSPLPNILEEDILAFFCQSDLCFSFFDFCAALPTAVCPSGLHRPTMVAEQKGHIINCSPATDVSLR